MSYSAFKNQLLRFNKQLDNVVQFISPVAFFNSLDCPEAHEYRRKNPAGVIFYGEQDLED